MPIPPHPGQSCELQCTLSTRINTITKIAEKAHISVEIAENCYNNFCHNYRDFFQFSEGCFCNSMISGERGSYYPLQLYVALTNRCHLKCLHCYKNATNFGTDINTENLLLLLSSVKDKVPMIALSGGEPTFHSDFEEIMEYAAKNFSVSVITSGYEISNKHKKIICGLADTIQVSLYSSDEETHNKFVMSDNAFRSTSNFISFINRAKAVSIITTFILSRSKNSYDNLKATVMYARNLGSSIINIGTIAPAGRGKKINYHVDNYTYQQLLSSIKNDFPEMQISSVDLEKQENFSNSSIECGAGTLFWSISEKGLVYLCPLSNSESSFIGNIDESIKELSIKAYKRASILREKLDTQKNATQCIVE